MSYIAERRQEEKERRRDRNRRRLPRSFIAKLGWDAVTMDSVATPRPPEPRAGIRVLQGQAATCTSRSRRAPSRCCAQRFTEATARAPHGTRQGRSHAAAPTWRTPRNSRITSMPARASNRTAHDENTKPSPQAEPCVECGKRVHEVVVEALATGQRDGTIRHGCR